MKIANLLSIALATGISIAAFTSSASAAVRDSSLRDATISVCVARAHRHYPGDYRDWGESRHLAYDACMHDAGQAQ